ncbi:uncharacterized protein LOC106644244 [Copidosoma floridanum]|uniref:uncharacterized protein LOC106644244 n=1 Tax=Copidosoma floridanum TaxID=29053 RepID=UPI0006C93C98|nr:uncharacterized protein LOC106644244 [Copidosoma floridanum]
MDLNKDAHKASQAAEKETQKNSINENHHSAVPIDPPPPYNEAIKIHPYQDSSYSAPLPYAPSLEPNNAISYPSNNFVPNNFPQSGNSTITCVCSYAPIFFFFLMLKTI